MEAMKEPWEEFYEVIETKPDNGKVVDKKTGQTRAFGDINFMRFHAQTLYEMEHKNKKGPYDQPRP